MNKTRRPSRLEMQRARHRRDSSYDGIFWVGVKTTRIYCRPSCPARPPLEKNVEYFFAPSAAKAFGLRACKRCRPHATDGAPPHWIQTVLDLSLASKGRRITDADLMELGSDPLRVRRWFQRHRGMTFHQYHRARRLGEASLRLTQGERVIDVAMEQGYSSTSGFQEAYDRRFGHTPKSAGMVLPLFCKSLESPVGPLEIAATPRGICLLEFADRRALPTEKRKLETHFKAPLVPGDNEHLQAATLQLQEYFAGTRKKFELTFDLLGTAFQRKVWRELDRIPYGETLSYGELARRVECPGGARAVGRANGANCIGIAIPCHRVIQADGQLRGYGGGLWRKQWLLELEEKFSP